MRVFWYSQREQISDRAPKSGDTARGKSVNWVIYKVHAKTERDAIVKVAEKQGISGAKDCSDFELYEMLTKEYDIIDLPHKVIRLP